MGPGVDRESIKRSIVEAVQGLVGRDVVVDDETTFAQLGLDSLGLVELALTLEEVWPIELRPEDYDRVETVSDVVSLIDGQVR